MKIIKNSLYIAQKDLLDFSRSRMRIIITLLMPLFMMLVGGFIFPNQNTVNNIPLGLVIEEKSPVADQIITSLDEINQKEKLFIFYNIKSTTEAKDLLNKGKIKGAVIIPQDFSKKISQKDQGEIIILRDDTDPQMAALLTNSLEKILGSISKSLGIENVYQLIRITGSKSPINAIAIIEPFIIKIQGLFEENINYFQFVAPGIMMMVVLMSIMTGLPRAISFEREIGTMDGMMAAPISSFSIITGKTIAQTIRGLIQAIIILLLSIFLFKVRVNGSIFLVFILILLGVLSFIGLGILLTSIARDQETASMLVSTFMFPMLLFSGVLFPTDQMPHFMQYISRILPLTYAVDALRRVMTIGVSLSVVSYDIIIL
ncbi:MAG: ABC transporter permease, partial [Actinobacteria bacterium]|nr:ABC transporter permease [Actinomycetota bacterium]